MKISQMIKKKELNDYIEHMHKWVKKYESMTEETERTGFQICIKNDSEDYIGWCNSYFIDDECNFSEMGNKCVIGIDIPERSAHRKGYASSALQLFIDYLFSCGKKEIYTQTWSGNMRMIRLANKLGFEEFKRKPDLRTVRGQKYDGLTFCLNHKLYQKLKERSSIS